MTFSRRDFIKTAASTLGALPVLPSWIYEADRRQSVKLKKIQVAGYEKIQKSPTKYTKQTKFLR